MKYEYGGCTTRREESRGSIGDDLEVEDYGGDGKIDTNQVYVYQLL
jgi:hypothetical protein